MSVLIAILSVVAVHAPFAMVHLSVAVAPIVNADTVVRGLFGKSMFAVP